MTRIFPQSAFGIQLPLTPLLVALELIFALLSGFCLIALGAGGGSWILGGIAAGALVFYVYRTFFNPQAQPNRGSRKLGQLLVGLTVGFSIAHSNLVSLSSRLPLFILLTVFLLGSGVLIGYLYSRVEKTDLLTAMLATVPGNIGVMASIAADYGRSASLVSLVQLVRFTTVILVIPLIADVSTPHDIGVAFSSLTKNLTTVNVGYLCLLVLVLGITTLAVRWGTTLKIPVAAFFCSIVVGIVFNSLLNSLPFLPPTDFNLPPSLNLVGQVLLGVTIGEYWGINPKLKNRTIAYTVIPVVLTFLAGLLSASIAMLLTPWDWLTCLLVASPGGSPEMILIALTFNHNVEIVTAGHLVRLMAINLLLPGLVSMAHYLENRPQDVQTGLTVINYSPTIKSP